MGIGNATGLLVFIITALIIVIAAGKLNKKYDRGHFDERQELVRGRGYKYATFTMLGLLAVELLMDEAGAFETLPVTHGFFSFFILIIGVLVYALYCIHHDSYFGVGTNTRYYSALIWIVIVCNIVPVITDLREGTVLENGRLDFGCGSHMLFVAAFTIIMVCYEVRSRKLRKEKADEES